MPPRDDPAHGAPRPPRGIKPPRGSLQLARVLHSQAALTPAPPRSRAPGHRHLLLHRLPLHSHRRQVPHHLPVGARRPFAQTPRASARLQHRPEFHPDGSLPRCQVVEVSQQYDGIPDCKSSFLAGTGATCIISLTVPRTMSPPVYVYYELNNAYFNHRRMVLSRSDAQLRGDKDIPDSLLKTCAPQQFQGGNGATLRVMRAVVAHACWRSGCATGADALPCLCSERADQPVRPCGVVVLQRHLRLHAGHRVRSHVQRSAAGL